MELKKLFYLAIKKMIKLKQTWMK